jgi:hypothetical protein
VSKPRGIKLDGDVHVALTVEMIDAYKIFVGKPLWKRSFGDLGLCVGG